MCGGRGTRLDGDVEKPLFEVAGSPMVEAVCDALLDSRVAHVFAATSPHAPETRARLRARDKVTVVETPGEGYVPDLDAALAEVGRPALTCAADLPLLAGDAVDDVLAAHAARDGSSLTVAVPAALKRSLGLSADTVLREDGWELAPTGVNVVGGDGSGAVWVTGDERLAVNVNRPADATVAARLATR
ncbi:MAG: NTP transferase domain-containing protein [Halorientalis sp.]